LAFREGLNAFERARYEVAAQAFNDVIDRPANRHTTSAMFLAGKTAYARGQYREAINILDRLTKRYPRTRYAAAARQTISNANRWIRVTESVSQDRLELAVVLPLNENSRHFSHALVTGIRMAVDEHNRAADGKPVQIRFRDSGGTEDSARRALEILARETTPAIVIGPLFSEEALTAAQVAERYRIPMFVPLATDDRVALGRDFVFQANPSYEIRGRAMARYAVQRKRYRRLGVVSEVETFANLM
jgi:ABC-type branched-subunit amino acid transport system substrate-binding protein